MSRITCMFLSVFLSLVCCHTWAADSDTPGTPSANNSGAAALPAATTAPEPAAPEAEAVEQAVAPTKAEEGKPAGKKDEVKKEEEEGHSVGHILLWYIPNRLFDVLDIVRLRVRVGPGMAIGARVTKLTEVYLGSYTGIYAGLPGPRGRKLPRLPVGLESRTGVAVSLADASTGLGFAPKYGYTECGLGFQLAFIGLDVGVDPMEVVDVALGLVTIDICKDDL